MLLAFLLATSPAHAAPVATAPAVASMSPGSFEGIRVDPGKADQMVGVHLPGEAPAAKLTKLLDRVPWSKADTTHRRGEVLGTEDALGALVRGVLEPLLPDGVRADTLALEIDLESLTIVSNDAAMAGRIRVRWVLRDRWNEVVARGASGTDREGPPDEPAVFAAQLLRHALQSIAGQSGFTKALADAATSTAAHIGRGPIAVPRCRRPATNLESARAASVLVRTESGIGSGARVSPGGFAVTAFHVVRNAERVEVRFEGGEWRTARVVRVAPELDAALLTFDDASGGCVAPPKAEPSIGTDVYAIGAPAGEALAFSVSRGVVSGYRDVHESLRAVQTDAATSPGNSGGPLVDTQGRWLAFMSFKVVGKHMEGLAFGIPAATALEALGVVAE